MKIGLFTATYLDMKLGDVCRMAADLGYQAVELPAFSGNPHVDLDEVLKGANAKALAKMIADHGLVISALANHPEGQIVLGPYGKDTDAICKGTKEEKIRFGTERMIKTAQVANALGVPVVTGFIGCENFGRFFPWPYSKGWADMEQEFVERWGKILDRFAEYGVKFAHEPHPNELAYDVEIYSWTGYLAPARVEDAIVARFAAAIQVACADPAIRAQFPTHELVGGTPEQFAAFIRDDLAKLSALLAALKS